MEVEYVFFDLGNVLVTFDAAIACRNVARLVERDERLVFECLYGSGLEVGYERGDMNNEAFAAAFRQQMGVECDTADLLREMSAMFTPNEAMLPVIEGLRRAGIPMGILSNTCAAHWNWIAERRWEVTSGWFEHAILSYRVHSMKPEAAIYEAAAEAVGVDPAAIFFTDDRMENITGARKAGWQAEMFVDAERLCEELHSAGLSLFA